MNSFICPLNLLCIPFRGSRIIVFFFSFSTFFFFNGKVFLFSLHYYLDKMFCMGKNLHNLNSTVDTGSFGGGVRGERDSHSGVETSWRGEAR